MKRYDFITLPLAAIIYSWLFFEHTAGINFLVFGLLYTTLMALRRPPGQWLRFGLAALAVVLSGVGVMLYASPIALLANIMALVLLTGYTYTPQASAMLSWLHGFISVIYGTTVGWVVGMYNLIVKPSSPPGEVKVKKKTSRRRFPRIITILVPLAISTVFLWFYQKANPAFRALLESIHINWPSAQWVLFTLWGLTLLLGAFYPRPHEWVNNTEKANPNALLRVRRRVSIKFRQMDLKQEYLTGWLTLAMVNVCLFFYHVTDLVSLGSGLLPQGVTYTEYLHQSVWTLIVSIAVAISIILYFFRGNLNFYRKNRLIKLFAYVWVAQNALLVATTAVKDWQYIEAWGLTYRRVGIFIYLTACLVGLVTTYFKISQTRSLWFMLRTNTTAILAMLVLASLVNWDALVTRYNLTHFEEPDYDYLFKIGQQNLHELTLYFDEHPHALDEGNPRLRTRLEMRQQHFITRFEREKWQSWTLLKQQTYQTLKPREERLQRSLSLVEPERYRPNFLKVTEDEGNPQNK